MRPQPTRLVVRAVSCDAKIIGSLVGGCRISVLERESGQLLAEGLQLGGSGDTDAIMKRPRTRGVPVFDSPGGACFKTELQLDEPTPVEIIAEGPLAYPDAIQRAGKSTWLLPGQAVEGDGLVLTLHGFIVEVIRPASVDVLHSRQPVEVEAGIRLLWGCPIEPGGLWDADKIEVRAALFHNGEQFEELELEYAGRTSVFRGGFRLPRVAVDYEVLEIRVTASQPAALNFGSGRQAVKLMPGGEGKQ